MEKTFKLGETVGVKVEGQVYGKSPAMEVLPDIRKANAEGLTELEKLANANMPPLITDELIAKLKAEAPAPEPAPSPAIAPEPAPAPAKEPAPPKGSVVVKAGATGALVPTTIQEAWLFCQRMAMSYTLPPAFYALPKLPDGAIIGPVNILEVATARAFQALQLGMEVGLPPAQAIQSVLVLNGIGTIWGDAQLALVVNSGEAVYVKEYTEGGDMFADGAANVEFTWVCETLRKGESEPLITKFSIADAIRANLWGAKTWKTHPGRMGKYKARAFCLRDKYPDVLKGLCHSTEEMQGELVDITPRPDHTTPMNPAEKLSSTLNNDMLKQVATGEQPATATKNPGAVYTEQSPPFSEKENDHAKTN